MRSAVLALAAVLCCAGCGGAASPATGSSAAGSTSSSPSTSVAPSTSSVPSVAPTGPLDASPFVRTDAACPLVDQPTVLDALGMRTQRVTVLKRAGAVIGCEYYPDPNWIVSENLPPVTQPVLQITSLRYADATTAYNAMARLGSAGGSPGKVTIAAGVLGIVYRTTFDPSDGAKDWACVFAKGTTVVTVKSAQTDNQLGPQTIAQALATTF